MMRNLFLSLILAPTLAFAAKEKQSSVETWIIDKDHTSIGFEIGHLVISSVEGSFTDFSGEIMFDPANDKKSAKSFSANVDIKTASINTGNDKRDKHLRSADFFNAKKNKQISFKTNKVRVKGKKKLKIDGDLTMAGVTKKVTLDVKYLGKVSAYDVERVAFVATTKVKREDFGLKWNDVVEAGPVVGSEVEIKLKVQAKRASDL